MATAAHQDDRRFWDAWIKAQAAIMVAKGASRGEAEIWFGVEARVRKEAARMIGKEAASVAPFRFGKLPNGAYGPMLLVDAREIPEPRRAAVQDFVFGPKDGIPKKN